MNAKEMFESLGYKYSRNYIKYYGDEVIEYYKTEGVKFVFLMKEHEFYVEYYEEPKHITVNELQAINKQCEELGWLDEKTEIKEARNPELTNFEYYKDEILDCCIDNLAVVKGIPKSCSKIDCNDCDFLTIQKECCEIAKDWLKQPYKKPKYKLTQCEYDMLDTIFEKEARFSRMYLIGELKKKGYFENIKCDSNVRVKDILANCEVIK